MAVFKVEGGHRLRGEITPQGAKNEALQILCATLLTPQRVVVRNIPRILDVMQLIELLRCACHVTFVDDGNNLQIMLNRHIEV